MRSLLHQNFFGDNIFKIFLETVMDEKITWEKPEIEDLGEAKDLIKNVFKAGTGDTEPGMNNILAPS